MAVFNKAACGGIGPCFLYRPVPSRSNIWYTSILIVPETPEKSCYIGSYNYPLTAGILSGLVWVLFHIFWHFWRYYSTWVLNNKVGPLLRWTEMVILSCYSCWLIWYKACLYPFNCNQLPYGSALFCDSCMDLCSGSMGGQFDNEYAWWYPGNVGGQQLGTYLNINYVARNIILTYSWVRLVHCYLMNRMDSKHLLKIITFYVSTSICKLPQSAINILNLFLLKSSI